MDSDSAKSNPGLDRKIWKNHSLGLDNDETKDTTFDTTAYFASELTEAIHT